MLKIDHNDYDATTSNVCLALFNCKLDEFSRRFVTMDFKFHTVHKELSISLPLKQEEKSMVKIISDLLKK